MRVGKMIPLIILPFIILPVLGLGDVGQSVVSANILNHSWALIDTHFLSLRGLIISAHE